MYVNGQWILQCERCKEYSGDELEVKFSKKYYKNLCTICRKELRKKESDRTKRTSRDSHDIGEVHEGVRNINLINKLTYIGIVRPHGKTPRYIIK